VIDPDDPSGSDEDRTVFRPASTPPADPAPSQTGFSQPGLSPSTPPAMTAMPGSFIPMAPRTGDAHIQVGDVLNHIFEVKRFIARGGMGEVFEGCNVNSDERVAIKVMLPALAADPSVQAMFRKEARTLTRLSHPALVAYRVLAQEPQLGVFYIVTEYIDGANLSDVLGTLKPTPAELLALTRRLAEGLRAAHALGAIHRDMSPDNVLLEAGAGADHRFRHRQGSRSRREDDHR
jgi:serine/threonine protein kinase